MSSPQGSPADGLHWFDVHFADRQGRCLITTGEAQHLRQLTTEWVERALGNLIVTHGVDWVESRACGDPGLVLHHSDASEVPDAELQIRPGQSLPPARGFR